MRLPHESHHLPATVITVPSLTLGGKLGLDEERQGRRDVRRSSSFLSSSVQSTELAMAAHSAQSAADRGVVAKARLSRGTCTTSTCRASDSAIAGHSQRLVNRPWKALVRSERELKAPAR
jgi:hypothetical protein